MLRDGVFKDEKTAEEQVVKVLKFDIHLVKDFRGRRYIERVTECIPVEEKNEYTYDYRKEKSLEGKLEKFRKKQTCNFLHVYFSAARRSFFRYSCVFLYVASSTD